MGQGDRRKSLYCWVGVHKWAKSTNAGARWQGCERFSKYAHKVVTAKPTPVRRRWGKRQR